jgi:acetyl-CoA carboxylase biotin carboxyl carrier protein
VDTEKIKTLAEILTSNGLTVLELSESECKIRLEKVSGAALGQMSHLAAGSACYVGGQPYMAGHSVQSGQTVSAGQPFVSGMPVSAGHSSAPDPMNSATPAVHAAQEAQVSESDAGVSGQADHSRQLQDVKSPLVGVFFSGMSPESEPLVCVGSLVKKGDILCIIEAMKLMNEIAAEHEGEIAEICVIDGDIVEFGQVLFRIR